MTTLSGQTVLLRDSKDDKYPYDDQYADFKVRPRWREFIATDYHPLGLITKVNEHFAYVDLKTKEYDYSAAASLIFRESDSDEDRETQRDIRKKVEDFWDYLPHDKGDVRHKFPHIFVDFDSRTGPFAAFFEYLETGHHSYPTRHWLNDSWKRVDIFPKDFSEPTIGTVHSDLVVEFDSETLRIFMHRNDSIRNFYDVENKYDCLKVRDVIAVANTATKDFPTQYIKITHKRTVLVKDYIEESGGGEYPTKELERRTGRGLKLTDSLAIFEFKTSYKSEFDKEQKPSLPGQSDSHQ